MSNKETRFERPQKKTGGILSIEEQDNESGSDRSVHLHSILQLGTRTNTFLIVVKINGIQLK